MPTTPRSGPVYVITDNKQVNQQVAAATAAKNAAVTARTGAETARTGAETARTGAETARTGAETARTGAETAVTAANTARSLSEVAANAAQGSSTSATLAALAAEAARDDILEAGDGSGALPFIADDDGTFAVSAAVRSAVHAHAVNHGLIADGSSHPINIAFPGITLSEAQAKWPSIPKVRDVSASFGTTTANVAGVDDVTIHIMTVPAATGQPLSVMSTLVGTGLAGGLKIVGVVSGAGGAGTIYEISAPHTLSERTVTVTPPQALTLTDEVDWAALQDTVEQAKLDRKYVGTYASGLVSALILFGSGKAVLNRTLDLTFIKSRGVFIESSGLMISSKMEDPNKPLIDMTMSRDVTVNGLTCYVDNDWPVSYGLCIGRNNHYLDSVAPANAFSNCKWLGYYSKAPVYNFAAELTQFNRCVFSSSSNNAYSYIGDGLNHWGFVSEYAGNRAPVDIEYPFTINTFRSCDFLLNGVQTAGNRTTPVWIACAKGHIFDGGYISANIGGPDCAAVTLYSKVAGDECSNMVFMQHDEGAGGNEALGADGTILQHNIYFAGDNPNPVYHNLKKVDVAAGEWMFAADPDIDTITLIGADIRVSNQGPATRKAFKTPSRFRVQGIVVLDQTNATTFWNLADKDFQGQLTIIGEDRSVRTSFFGQFGATQRFALANAAEQTLLNVSPNTSIISLTATEIITSQQTIVLPANSGNQDDIPDGQVIDIYNDSDYEIRVFGFSPSPQGWPITASGANGVLASRAQIRVRWDDGLNRWTSKFFPGELVSRVVPTNGQSLVVPAGTTIYRLAPAATIASLTLAIQGGNDRSLMTFFNDGPGDITSLAFSPDITGYTDGGKFPAGAVMHVRRNAAASSPHWQMEDRPIPQLVQAFMDDWLDTLPTSASGLSSREWWRDGGKPTRVT